MRTPGHYISLQRNATQADFVRPLSMPGVVGVQVRFTWRELEPFPNCYNFSRVKASLDTAASEGGKLVVFIEDKTFTDEHPLPDWLDEFEYRNRQGGYTAARWNGYVASDLNALCDAIYAEFSDHEGFGGIALQETAPGLDDEALDASSYSADGYIYVLTRFNCDYLYINYLPRAQDRLGEVIAGTKAMVGGPDVLPNSKPLQTHVYPHFVHAPNKVRQFSSMQFDSYEHEGWTLDDLIMWATDRYPDIQTLNRIRAKGGTGLRVETLFWNDKTWPTPKGSYTVEDAYAAIARRPVL